MITKLFDETSVQFPEQLISRGDYVDSDDLSNFYEKEKQKQQQRKRQQNARKKEWESGLDKDVERLRSMVDTSKTFITKIVSFKHIRDEMYKKGLLERDKKIEEMKRKKLAEEREKAKRLALIKKKEEEERALNAPLLSQLERTNLDSKIKGFL